MTELKEIIKSATKDTFGVDIEPELTRPEEQFGDYSTNVAMQLATQIGKKPSEIADQLVEKLRSPLIAKTEVASPGFINFKLSNEAIAKAAFSSTDLPKPLAGQEILVEFGDPNPFKEMHIGHLYSYIVGDTISSLLEANGAKVHRLSYHGDVGLHVAKAIWAVKYKEDAAVGFHRDEVVTDTIMSGFYAAGAEAYERDEHAKAEIDQINQKIYDKSDPKVNELYEWGREQSFKYFDQILKHLSIKPTRRFLESESAEKGIKLVKQNEGKVFEKSDGAVVFNGEKAGLHTRVFITSKGLPTYEAKDLGLAELKKEAFPKAKKSIIITAHEQAEYFKVMLAALHEFDTKTADMTTHLYHGFISLSTGKMSSRTGHVYSALSLIADVDVATEKVFSKQSDSTRNAAIKYGFLRHRFGSDIVYDVTESISLEGNSGPYLQYAHARACSILKKVDIKQQSENSDLKFEPTERSLARKVGQYSEVVAAATAELMPSHICTYLYELAQTFNHFYETNQVIGDPRESLRIKLVQAYANVLKNGLELLNIPAPERI